MIRTATALLMLSLSTAAQAQQILCEQVSSIGVATMAGDGTITLRVRSLPPGPIGEGMLEYPPSHSQYQEILKHLGGLVPG